MIWGPSSFNGGDWVFQPKNNPLIKDFFQENNVTLLYYPDLNPLRTFGDGRQGKFTKTDISSRAWMPFVKHHMEQCSQKPPGNTCIKLA